MAKIYIKNKKIFKNKYQMVAYICIFTFLIYLFIYFGTKDYSSDVADNIRFSQEYSLVSEENVFTYGIASDVFMIANGKKGIVLFGNSSNEWVNYYAKILNEVAKEVGIKKIVYYDFFEDRNQNNGTYETIVNLLGNYVNYNDKGKADIYSPTLLVVCNDEILYYDDETSFVSGKVKPVDYWSDYQIGLKKNELRAVFANYLES